MKSHVGVYLLSQFIADRNVGLSLVITIVPFLVCHHLDNPPIAKGIGEVPFKRDLIGSMDTITGTCQNKITDSQNFMRRTAY